jgi:hypothetical protein
MRSILPVFLLTLPCALFAQDSLITVNPLPDEVRVGQIYNVVWNVEADDADVEPPDAFPGFEKLVGPVEGSNSEYTNGVSVRSVSYAYSLRVAETGTIALPDFRATVNGETISHVSKPVRSLPKGEPGSTPDAMSKALFRAVTPEGSLSAYVHEDGGYITRMEGSDEVVKRFLTANESAALEKYLDQLLDQK